MDSLTLTLGGQTFALKPLTFKQLRGFTPAFIKFGGRLATPEAFDELANAILSCTMRDNPEFTRMALDDSPVTPQELLDAADQLAEFSGLFKKKAGVTGEATAGATANL